MKTYDWIVVGGGIAGAALAYELVKTGFAVLLLEQYQTPQNATRYSYGGLAYWSGTTPPTRQLCEEAIAMYLKLQVPTGELPDFMGLYGVTELPAFWQPFYSFPLTIASVVLIPGLLAGLLGYLVFRNRLKGVYFSILTQAGTIVFFNFFNGQQQLFNGTNRLIDFTTLFRAAVSDAKTQFVFYTLTVVFLAATYGICRWLTTGRFGRLLIAIRDDESRVRFSGYDPTDFKVLVFAVSGAISGILVAFYTI